MSARSGGRYGAGGGFLDHDEGRSADQHQKQIFLLGLQVEYRAADIGYTLVPNAPIVAAKTSTQPGNQNSLPAGSSA